MSMSSGLADMSRMHVQEMFSANLYDRNAEPDAQARLCSALFVNLVIVLASKMNTAPSVFVGL